MDQPQAPPFHYHVVTVEQCESAAGVHVFETVEAAADFLREHLHRFYQVLVFGKEGRWHLTADPDDRLLVSPDGETVLCLSPPRPPERRILADGVLGN